MEEEEKLKKWFLKNERFFSITAWEDEIKAPRGTLTRFVKGQRGLSSQWIKPMEKLITKMKLK